MRDGKNWVDARKAGGGGEGGEWDSEDSPEPTELTEVTPSPESRHFSCACVVTEAPGRQVHLGSYSYSPPWPPAQALQFNPSIIQLVMWIKEGNTSHTKEMAKISRHGPAGSRRVSWNWVLKVYSQ